LKTLILGIGNPIMRDDAAGVVAAQRLAQRIPAEVVTGAASGLAVLDQLSGYDRAIIVDATHTGQDAPGTVRRWEPPSGAEAEPAAMGPGGGGAHEVGLPGLLTWGTRTLPDLPTDIVVYTIEATELSTLGEGLSAAVEEGIARLVDRVVQDHFAGHGTTAPNEAAQ
jgi:hydrogenase maturation protease